MRYTSHEGCRGPGCQTGRATRPRSGIRNAVCYDCARWLLRLASQCPRIAMVSRCGTAGVLGEAKRPRRRVNTQGQACTDTPETGGFCPRTASDVTIIPAESAVMRLLLELGFLGLMTVCADAHDQYTGLTDNAGFPCCGSADCEPVSDFTMHRDGSVSFVSRRYRATITVPGTQVIRISIPGAPAHWCGGPHYDFTRNFYDSGFDTFCAFLEPDGT